jgi:cobalamin synthase
MKHMFGGVTGDLIGATNEVVETGLLVFVAATLSVP